MLEEIIEDIKRLAPKKIAVQLPEGLKSKWLEVEAELSDYEVVFLGESCFGACDLRDHEAKEVGADILIHIGHSHMSVETELKTFFVEYHSDLDISKVVKQAANDMVEENIGLVTTVQHIHKLGEAQKLLEEYSKKVFIGKPEGRALHTGQLLGCDASAAAEVKDKVDCYLYIGTGDFHPIAVALDTGKKVYIADPEKDEVRTANEQADKFLKRRFAKIEKAKKAKTFGILLSLKKGQKREKLANVLKESVERAGRKAVLIALNDFSPDKLLGFRVDAYVNTACTRIAIDDADIYEKPMLNPMEMDIALGKRKWEDYELDRF
ncbi:MAG: diphthamide biosynthesis enzyme Dph2 [archaeon]